MAPLFYPGIPGKRRLSAPLYRDRGMACGVVQVGIWHLCMTIWVTAIAHQAGAQRGWGDEDKYSRKYRHELFGHLCSKMMIALCKAELIIIHFFFTFPKLPTSPLIFGWGIACGYTPVEKSLEKEGKVACYICWSVSPSSREGLKCSRWIFAPGIRLMIMPSSADHLQPWTFLDPYHTLESVCACILTPPYFPAAGKEPQDFQSGDVSGASGRTLQVSKLI